MAFDVIVVEFMNIGEVNGLFRWLMTSAHTLTTKPEFKIPPSIIEDKWRKENVKKNKK